VRLFTLLLEPDYGWMEPGTEWQDGLPYLVHLTVPAHMRSFRHRALLTAQLQVTAKVATKASKVP
jgi:hypothetical protein